VTTPGEQDPPGASTLEPGIEGGQQMQDAGALEDDGSGRDRPGEDVGEQALREAERSSGLAPDVEMDEEVPYEGSGGRGESAGR
jgi:hypothetical protein